VAWGEDFHSIIEEETAALRSKHRLRATGKSDRAIRFQNDKVFVEFWYDRNRNHFVQADIGLLQKTEELRESYGDHEVAVFYGTDRWDHHPQGKPVKMEVDDRLLIRPQVCAISAMLVAIADRLFAGNVEEFVRLHYFSSGYNTHYTETVSKPKAEEAPQPSPKRAPVGTYVLLSLLIGVLAGVAAERFDLWRAIPILVDQLWPR
jgi:hypothetical protein